MKIQKMLILILGIALSAVRLSAQDCGYYSLSKGTVMTYQSLDGKGKITGTSRMTCIDVISSPAMVKYKVRLDSEDAKADNKTSHEVQMRCENGKFYMDMQNFLDPSSMEGFKDMQLTVDSKDMEFPAGLAEGMSLPDASLKLAAASEGVTIMNMTIFISNRKVAGKETVTVPAGTFECYKLTYDLETKMMFKMTTSVTEYLCMGVGSIKTETYDKKGKLLGTTVLSEVKK
jgi:hypothetical protein